MRMGVGFDHPRHFKHVTFGDPPEITLATTSARLFDKQGQVLGHLF